PSPRRIDLPEGWRLEPGCGTVLAEGDAAMLVAYGPVMLHEALVAEETLRASRTRLTVVDLPWLNRFDRDWLAEAVAPYADVFVLDDHAPIGALGDGLRRELSDASLSEGRAGTVFGVEGWPACGTAVDAPRVHRPDRGTIAQRIAERLGVRSLT